MDGVLQAVAVSVPMAAAAWVSLSGVVMAW
jgi:hypothetical protein